MNDSARSAKLSFVFRRSCESLPAWMFFKDALRKIVSDFVIKYLYNVCIMFSTEYWSTSNLQAIKLLLKDLDKWRRYGRS